MDRNGILLIVGIFLVISGLLSIADGITILGVPLFLVGIQLIFYNFKKIFSQEKLFILSTIIGLSFCFLFILMCPLSGTKASWIEIWGNEDYKERNVLLILAGVGILNLIAALVQLVSELIWRLFKNPHESS